jgi:DNA gyrase subunit A
MVIVDPAADVLTICERGHGKRTTFDEYRVQSRGGMGIINIRASERNGKVVAVREVHETDEVMVLTEKGMVIRTPVSAISSIGRATQGVRILQVEEGDRVRALARLVPEEAEPEEVETGPTEPTPPSSPPAAKPPAAPSPERNGFDAEDDGADGRKPPSGDDEPE